MLQVQNKSRFAPMVNVLADETGVDTLYVVVKATFQLAEKPEPATQQIPPRAEDEYWGHPGESSLRYASEVHVGKRGTDVVLVGSAHAPGGRPVTEMLAALTVSGRRKVVRVLGDRTWRGPSSFTRPEPFVAMPLVYERAFGGRHDVGRGQVLGEDRNPVGVGFGGRRARAEAAGMRLPNLEDPRVPIAAFGDRPSPAGLGFVAPSWLPRRAHAGTYDASWVRNRAPYLPVDFDRRFDNAACPELAFDRFLGGGEPLTLDGVTRDGQLHTSIPTLKPRVEVRISGARRVPAVDLETVLVEPDEARLCLTWRAALQCDKRALRIDTITVEEVA